MESFDLPMAKVKDEPPEEYVLYLPQPPDDDLSAEEEGEGNVSVKEEPQEDCVLTLLPTTNDQLQPTTNDQLQPTTNPKQQPGKKHHCPSCGQGFFDKNNLQWHLSSTTMFKCAVCDAEFACTLLRNRHERDHGVKLSIKSSYKAIVCVTCHKAFPTNDSLKLHQKQLRHGTFKIARKEILKCDKCGKTYSSPRYFVEHKIKVHGETEARWRRLSELLAKRSAGSAARNSEKRLMEQPLRVHSGERSFKCDLCEYTLAHKHR